MAHHQVRACVDGHFAHFLLVAVGGIVLLGAPVEADDHQGILRLRLCHIQGHLGKQGIIHVKGLIAQHGNLHTLDRKNANVLRVGPHDPGIGEMLLGFQIHLFPMVHDVVIFQRHSFDAIVREHGYILRRRAEEKRIFLFIIGNVSGVGQRAFKVDQRHIVFQENIPDIAHGKVDVAALFFQLVLKDFIALTAVIADGHISREGSRNGAYAAGLIHQLNGFLTFGCRLLHRLQACNDFGTVPAHQVHQGQFLLFLRPGSRQQQAQRQQYSKYLSHGFPPFFSFGASLE